ncbi:GntR family transcriptional regulator [Burkholderia sp. WAC0059]|uniref:GntR family transcriptional regulator n=1 Tax=Burkholderia sp. WAC0059 TaxID=2066022 RepID=UPI000C7EA22C|nr:GntR family transcriptional regulator [Burkholderia sp. WAC0059]PLZ00756.1 GntR family transcriptional regulator [Burkholderia sp. WAC0059]
MAAEEGPLNTTAYAALKRRIINGELLPGTPLSERALCETFDVSRTPLREALKLLANEGLVEISPTRRASVARITVDEAVSMLTVMAVLEGLSGEQACEKVNERDLAELSKLQDDMRDAYLNRDKPRYFARNQQIHLTILRIADNRPLADYFHNLNARLRQVRQRLNPTQEGWRHAVEEHEEMLALLQRRDGKRLRALMENHLRAKTDVFLATMLNDGLVSAGAPPRRRAAAARSEPAAADGAAGRGASVDPAAGSIVPIDSTASTG